MKLIIQIEKGTVTGIYYTDSTALAPAVCALPDMLACDVDALRVGDNGITKHVPINLRHANERTQQVITGMVLK